MAGDEEDDLSRFDKFWDDEDDTVKPIDRQGDPLRATEPLPDKPPSNPAPNPAPDVEEGAPKLSPADQGDKAEPRDPSKAPSNLDEIMGEKNKGADSNKDANRLAEERFLKDIDAEQEKKDAAFLNVGERTLIKKGDYFDLLARDPALHDIYVAAGWDQRSFENAPIDVDLSMFLLNKDDETREDGDFVFYNNMTACEGAIKLMDDSRTGAGDGDDESMFLDLRGIPFDVVKVRFVLSVYDENYDGFSFDGVRNVYLRLGNNVDDMELFCVEIEPIDLAGAKAIEVGTLVREGPKWFFSVESKAIDGGLAGVAKSYGMLITEDTG